MHDEVTLDLALETAQRMLSRFPRAEAIHLALEQEQVLDRNDDFWPRVVEYLRVLPVPGHRLNGSQFPKKCSGCGRMLSQEDWDGLKFIGFQVIGPWPDDPGEVLDMRNDFCNSTLAELAPFTAAEFEAEVEREISNAGGDIKLARQLAAERLRSH